MDPQEGETETDKFGIFYYQAKGGAGFFLNNVVSIDLGNAYRLISVKAKEDNDANHKDITSQFGLEVVVMVVF